MNNASRIGEHRLCHQLLTGPIGPMFLPEDVKKQAADKGNEADKKNIENQNKRKELRSKLAELTKEVGQANEKAKVTKQLDELRKKQQSLNLLLGSANNQDLIREIAQDLAMPDLEERLRRLGDTNAGQDVIQQLTKGLNGLSQGTNYQEYTTPEGIMKMARQMVEGETGRRFLDFAREYGLTIENETAIRMLFLGMRTLAAKLFSTSPLFNMFPELREQGRKYHYRMALEGRIRELGNSALPLTDLVTRPTEELELRAMGPDAGVRKNAGERWNKMYFAWRTLAQNSRRSVSTSTSLTQADPPIPTIAQAMDEQQTKDYIAALNQTPTQPTTQVENGPPRIVDTVPFNGPTFAMEVTTQQMLPFTVNGTRLEFHRDNNGPFIRLPALANRVIRFGTINNAAITHVHLMAPNTNSGDVQIRLNNNIAQPGVPLTLLQREALLAVNPNRNIVNFPSSTTVQFN